MKRRTSRRNQVLSLLALALLTVPVIVPAQSVEVVTGHTVYVDMDSLDPCLAAVAGMVRSRVLWFDGSLLHERTNFDGDSYIYATQHGAPDPTHHMRWENITEIEDAGSKVLVTSQYYNFTDPNGIHWNVTEVYWEEGVRYNVSASADGDSGQVSANYQEADNATAGTNRYYAWIVQIGKTTQDLHAGTADHEVYNFVNLVNTCKFNEDAKNGSVNHTNDPPGFEHDDNTTYPHDHQTWDVDLYVGNEPSSIPLGQDPDNTVNSQGEHEGDREGGTS